MLKNLRRKTSLALAKAFPGSFLVAKGVLTSVNWKAYAEHTRRKYPGKGYPDKLPYYFTWRYEPYSPGGRRLYHYRRSYKALLSKKLFGGELEGKNILDIGAGTGLFTKFLQDQHGCVATALDIGKKETEVAMLIGNKNIVRADASKLPLNSASQDAIISKHFLFCGVTDIEETNKQETILKEAARVLKPGGFLILDNIDADQYLTKEQKKKLESLGFDTEPIIKDTFNESIKEVDPWPDFIVLRKRKKGE